MIYTTATIYGYPIEYVDGEWVYSESGKTLHQYEKERLKEYTDALTYDNLIKEKCSHCNIPKTEEGHDGCLGELIGVRNACCGHGNIEDAYIQFWDRSGIRGNDAISVMDVLKRNRNAQGNVIK